MYTKWSMAESYRNKLRSSGARLLLAVMCLSLLAGCSLLPQEEEQEKLPDIRIPKISQKPEYPVKKGTLELKVSGSGKLMSEREENLLFSEDNLRVVEVYVKAGDQVKKGQVLAALDTGDTDSQIRRKEIDLEKTELDLKDMMRDSSEDNAVLLKKKKLDYELLNQELADLRSKLEGSKLVAPYAGTIVSFTAKKGDMAKAYEKVGQIADMGALVVAVQFASGDLASIAPGMETLVGINTAGDHPGSVRRLPVGTGQNNNDADSLDKYTLIDLPKLPEGVAHGTPLSASVIMERRNEVLIIPLSALRTQNNRKYVLVSNEDGSKGEVDVETGIQTSTHVEIIKGLEEGQKVVGK
ncbi:efflux RND transporter periplasmic adaptor subunit [Paenibacillus eucommiae]|uniref:Macrolide-specific efflux system membrane fusion protein n=1 Tax=Paenibacillus eucommiae TaxID=1355755 RepID=A0ABS4J8C0_9BACL|nr:efflux RND transporter periplasmic adaptor subunit [Paenibacillus eucommiae]MBP1996097.1 macrolide-specific efflux system membrane fusion protein [Paenibacillus eucommiae]